MFRHMRVIIRELLRVCWITCESNAMVYKTALYVVHLVCTYRCIPGAQRITEERSCNLCCKNSSMYYIFWVCVCSRRYPSMQCTCAISSFVTSLAVQCFSKYLKSGAIFEKMLYNVKIDLVFSTTFFATFLFLRRTEGDMIQIVYWPSCTVAVILVRF
jgi:hypothetical protein